MEVVIIWQVTFNWDFKDFSQGHYLDLFFLDLFVGLIRCLFSADGRRLATMIVEVAPRATSRRLVPSGHR